MREYVITGWLVAAPWAASMVQAQVQGPAPVPNRLPAASSGPQTTYPRSGPAGAAPALGPQRVAQLPDASGQVAPAANSAQLAPATPKQPDWFPLPPDHAQYLDKVLQFWQFRTEKIQQYQCDFTRWEYDPVFGPRNPANGELIAKTESAGEVKYGAPDKGVFKVNGVKDIKLGAAPGAAPTYVVRKDAAGSELPGEHWLCDGKSVFEYNYRDKVVNRFDLPQEMRGQAIVDGPLPFMFGANSDKLKSRYWFRVVTPPNIKDQYWLEGVPKTQRDAANYERVEIIIDQTEYLPLALRIFSPGGGHISYQFENRKVISTGGLTGLFSGNPFAGSVPFGWKLVVEKGDTGTPSAPGGPQGPQPGFNNKSPQHTARPGTPAGGSKLPR